jgi:hypothetical protein
MNLLTSLLLQLALASPAFSQWCRVEKGKLREPNPHFTVVLDKEGVNKVTTVLVSSPPTQNRTAAAELLRSVKSDSEWVEKVGPFLVQNGTYILSLRNQFMSLVETLVLANISYVAIDVPPEYILGLEKETWGLLTNGLKNADRKDEEVENMLLLVAGPALALRVRHSSLFVGVRLEGIPPTTPGKPPGEIANNNPPASAEDLYQNVLEQLKRNTASRDAFVKMAAGLKKNPNPYPQLSREETKQRLLQRFWTQAKKPVGEWLDVALVGANANQATASPPTANSRPEGISGFILSRTGNWLVYLAPSKYTAMERDFARLCPGT